MPRIVQPTRDVPRPVPPGRYALPIWSPLPSLTITLFVVETSGVVTQGKVLARASFCGTPLSIRGALGHWRVSLAPGYTGANPLFHRPSSVQLPVHSHRCVPVVQAYGRTLPERYKTDVPLAPRSSPPPSHPAGCRFHRRCPCAVNPPHNTSRDMMITFALLSVALSALGLIGAARAQAPSPCLVGCLQSASACAPYVPPLFTRTIGLSPSPRRLR